MAVALTVPARVATNRKLLLGSVIVIILFWWSQRQRPFKWFRGALCKGRNDKTMLVKFFG